MPVVVVFLNGQANAANVAHGIAFTKPKLKARLAPRQRGNYSGQVSK
jgi:hypothetical protein